MILRGLSHNNTETPRQESIKLIANFLHIFLFPETNYQVMQKSNSALDPERVMETTLYQWENWIEEKEEHTRTLCLWESNEKIPPRLQDKDTSLLFCEEQHFPCANDSKWFSLSAFTLPADTPSCRSLAFVSPQCCCAVPRQRTSSENGWLILKGRNKKGRQMFGLFA